MHLWTRVSRIKAGKIGTKLPGFLQHPSCLICESRDVLIPVVGFDTPPLHPLSVGAKLSACNIRCRGILVPAPLVKTCVPRKAAHRSLRPLKGEVIDEVVGATD
jgi:hypothetical protein